MHWIVRGTRPKPCSSTRRCAAACATTSASRRRRRRRTSIAACSVDCRERLPGRLLLGVLLRPPDAGAEGLLADHGGRGERAVVWRPFDAQRLVGDGAPRPRELLLELRLVVDVRVERVIDPR